MCTLRLLAPGPEPLRFTFPNPPQPFSFSFSFFFFSFEFQEIRVEAKGLKSRREGGGARRAVPALLAGTRLPFNARRKKAEREMGETGCKLKAARSLPASPGLLSGRCKSIPRFPPPRPGTAKRNRTCSGCSGRAAPRTSQPRPPAQLRRGPPGWPLPLLRGAWGLPGASGARCLACSSLPPEPGWGRRSQAERGQNEGVGSSGGCTAES